MFAAVMVIGVSMQSCKSKKLVQSTSAVDSVNLFIKLSISTSSKSTKSFIQFIDIYIYFTPSINSTLFVSKLLNHLNLIVLNL